MKAILPVLLMLCVGFTARGAEWVRAGLNANQPVWGVRGGLQFAIHPGGFRGPGGGPRGLIRLGYPILTNGGYDLVNFIAVEPVVGGRKGFSELEKSTLDGVPGKRFWIDSAPDSSTNALPPGDLTGSGGHAEQLDLQLCVEKFDNGAHVRLAIRQRAAAPDEIQITVHAEPDSAPVEYCILTATMGNMARTRDLWLREKNVSSLRLYPGYRDSAFAPHTHFARDQLLITPAGELLVVVTNDEADPAIPRPFPNSDAWRYDGVKVTQYWKMLRGTWHDEVEAVVNARFTYWRSTQPIPGGVAFENFELRERFHEGQTSVFGVTHRTPRELGFSPR
jgi:hypothetical protein